MLDIPYMACLWMFSVFSVTVFPATHWARECKANWGRRWRTEIDVYLKNPSISVVTSLCCLPLWLPIPAPPTGASKQNFLKRIHTFESWLIVWLLILCLEKPAFWLSKQVIQNTGCNKQYVTLQRPGKTAPPLPPPPTPASAPVSDPWKQLAVCGLMLCPQLPSLLGSGHS